VGNVELIPFSDVLAQVDMPWVRENTERLWQTERGQCFRHYRQAALLTEQLLRESGVERVDRIVVPADGTLFEGELDIVRPNQACATRCRVRNRRASVAVRRPRIGASQSSSG
jgi:hypothetical protein